MLTPRENTTLFGHQNARDAFLQAFYSPRCPHAWILGGAFGIGKTTFAFHFARYVLSGRQDRNTQFTKEDPLYRRIIAHSHGDLWTVGEEDEGEIGVEPIRSLVNSLHQTALEGGWRVLIIDGADRMNHNAANALLKSLEEPPARTLFFLTTSLPEHLLPTIRSRCHFLSLTPLEDKDVEAVLKAHGLQCPSFFEMAEGSPGRLIRFMEGTGSQLYGELGKVLEGAPALPFIHAYGGEESTYHLIENFIRTFLHKALLNKVEERPSFFDKLSLNQTLNMHQKIEDLFDQCKSAQLEKKTTLTCVFENLRRGTTI